MYDAKNIKKFFLVKILKNKWYVLSLVISVLLITFIAVQIIESNQTTTTIAKFDNLAKEYEFIIGGEAVGIKLLATGVLVVGIDRNNSNIAIGDIILQVDGVSIESNAELIDRINAKGNVTTSRKVQLLIDRNGTKADVVVNTTYNTKTNKHELGLWVKDSSAGVGTVTFYEKNNKYFAVLGHGVTETTAGLILPITSGAIVKTTIQSIKKGVPKEPGDIRGTIYKEVYGEILANTGNGIYGVYYEEIPAKQTIKVASKYDVREGKASIFCTLIDNTVQEFGIEIDKVILDSKGNKNMVIRITDEKLLELSGGIVQGMSGSPIVQDGKLVGAITHVLLNDPTKGYAVFIQNMIEDMNNLHK